MTMTTERLAELRATDPIAELVAEVDRLRLVLFARDHWLAEWPAPDGIAGTCACGATFAPLPEATAASVAERHGAHVVLAATAAVLG